jgi:hypothetical protein
MCLRFLLVLALLIVVGPVVADPPLPIPSEDDQDRTLKQVKDVFKFDYAKMGPVARAALAEKLFLNGVQTKSRPGRAVRPLS